MQIGKAMRPKPGEFVSGDHFIVCNNGGGMLIAVADGLGHGPHAAEAATGALNYVEAHSGASLANLIIDCGKAISATRGVALTLMRLDSAKNEMLYAAVGNVEIRAISKQPIRPVNYPGIVGRKIRRVQETSHVLSTGDIIVMFTDGISSRFDLEKYKQLDAQDMADKILAEHGKRHDDATCITIRY